MDKFRTNWCSHICLSIILLISWTSNTTSFSIYGPGYRELEDSTNSESELTPLESFILSAFSHKKPQTGSIMQDLEQRHSDGNIPIVDNIPLSRLLERQRFRQLSHERRLRQHSRHSSQDHHNPLLERSQVFGMRKRTYTAQLIEKLENQGIRRQTTEDGQPVNIRFGLGGKRKR